MLEKIKELRRRHLEGFHGIVFYPYQEQISDKIINALIQNLKLTDSATEEDIKSLETVELSVEISRQAGKTTAIVLTVDLIMRYFPTLFGMAGKRRLEIEIFAPQQEQAKTDFDRLKEALLRSSTLEAGKENQYREENNAKTIVLPNGASCYIAPVTKTSKPESKSPALMIFEEAQDLDDKIVKEQIWPMGANTNAPRFYIGTAGTQLCYFRDLGMGANSLKLYFEDIAKQRRKVYEQTNDVRHLVYEQYVRKEIEKHGIESDEIQRPYFGKWLIGTGQFTTEEELDELQGEHPIRITKEGECYVGIDTAKHPDSTVVTVVQVKDNRRRLINWLELRGENYGDQFLTITGYDTESGQKTGKGFLDGYNVTAVAIDSTGQGDFMPDMFEKHTEWQDEDTGLYRLKFNQTSKDLMYRNLKATIKQCLLSLPKTDIKEADRFRAQMLNLQQEYKGQFLSVSHPDDPNAHDDYPDSLALAEWAYARWNQTEVGAVLLDDKNISKSEEDEESKVKTVRNEENEITHLWPDDNDWD